MPNLNEIDDIGDITERELEKLLSVVVNKALLEIEAGAEIAIRSLYAKESRDIVMKGIVSASVLGLEKAYVIPSIEGLNEYYLNSQYYGSTLSNRLYRDAQRAQRAAEAVVKQHVASKTTWQRLAVDLRKKAVTVDDLPQYLLDVQKAFNNAGVDGKMTTELKRAISRAEKRIAKFTNENGITRSNLTRSYSDVVKAAKKGDSALLKKKMTIAIDKKAINNSQRLSRSEISRAYGEAEIRRMTDDPDIIGKRSVLSPSHPRPDECNYHAEVDGWGMGAGVSPIGQGTPLGYHARCICSYEDVLRKEGDKVGRFSKERSEEYLKGLSDEKRHGIVDKHGVVKGYKGAQDLVALPRELVESI